MTDPNSETLFDRAQRVLPGGVNSPVRAFKAVHGDPIFIRSASGPTMTGENGRQYVDYVGSWGPMILGHAHPEVLEVIRSTAGKGSSFGAPTLGEVQMAERIAELVPSMQMSRLVSSGTEATMAAIRVARGFTGRDLVVKCIGGYHGGADYLLVKAGSGLATLGEPDSAGVPESIASTTLLVHYNDADGLRALFTEHRDSIAAVIVEPVAGNMGCVPPAEGYLQSLAQITKDNGALLIFDEVMTGFRVALGGAQARYKVTPDLTCLGKIVGGGLPVGAYGGRVEIMQKVAPVGPVYQAGTLSGNPLAVAAGLKTLELLSDDGVYEKLEKKGAALQASIEKAANDAAVAHQVQRVGSMLTVFFKNGSVRSWDDAAQCDKEAFARWHGALLEQGVYWPPSQFEAAFVSLAHGEAELEATAEAMRKAFFAV